MIAERTTARLRLHRCAWSARQRADVQLLNGRLPAIGKKKIVQRTELVGQLGLAHRIAKVEQHARAAENALARAKHE